VGTLHTYTCTLHLYFCGHLYAGKTAAHAVDPLDWTKNCLHLAEFYLGEGNYVQAEHVLKSGHKMFSMLPVPADRAAESEENGNGSWSKMRADLDFKWANLFGGMLSEGREQYRDRLLAGAARAGGGFDDRTDEEKEKEAARMSESEDGEAASSSSSSVLAAAAQGTSEAPDDGGARYDYALSHVSAEGGALRFEFTNMDAVGRSGLMLPPSDFGASDVDEDGGKGGEQKDKAAGEEKGVRDGKSGARDTVLALHAASTGDGDGKAAGEAAALLLTPLPEKASHEKASAKAVAVVAGEAIAAEVSPGLPEGVTKPEHVDTFKRARSLFLSAKKCLESGQVHYVLDGFVTDHCQALQVRGTV
jgi:hypothetical protein